MGVRSAGKSSFRDRNERPVRPARPQTHGGENAGRFSQDKGGAGEFRAEVRVASFGGASCGFYGRGGVLCFKTGTWDFLGKLEVSL